MAKSIDTTLAQFVDQLTVGVTPELARHFADLPEPNPEFQKRLVELAEKANEGTLTADEAKLYDRYVEYIDFVTLHAAQSKGAGQHAFIVVHDALQH